MKALFAGCVLFSLACGPSGADVTRGDRTETGSSRLSLGPATLVFNSNWTTQVYGQLAPGTTVNLQYAFDRLSSCTGNPDGGLGQWTATAYYEVSGGTVSSTVLGGTAVAGGGNPSFVIPNDPGNDLVLWFSISNASGCTAYDSAYGANYHFSLQSYPVIQFNADWTQSIDGLLPGATGFFVDYDLSRLPQCRATYNGYAAWNTIAWYAWDGAAAQSEPVTVSQGMSLVAASPLLLVPSGARQLALWFENSDDNGCVGWDSAYGANYNYGFQ
jgi:hypothetical protein